MFLALWHQFSIRVANPNDTRFVPFVVWAKIPALITWKCISDIDWTIGYPCGIYDSKRTIVIPFKGMMTHLRLRWTICTMSSWQTCVNSKLPNRLRNMVNSVFCFVPDERAGVVWVQKFCFRSPLCEILIYLCLEAPFFHSKKVNVFGVSERAFLWSLLFQPHFLPKPTLRQYMHNWGQLVIVQGLAYHWRRFTLKVLQKLYILTSDHNVHLFRELTWTAKSRYGSRSVGWSRTYPFVRCISCH